MSPKIHLNARDVFKKAKALYEAKGLSAQVTPEAKKCYYSDANDAPCAVGAGMTRDDRALLVAIGKNAEGISRLVKDGIVVTDDSHALSILQSHHDNWALTSPGEARDRFEQSFVANINNYLARAA